MSSAGKARFRVRFDKQTEVEDPAGGTTSGWQEQFTRWADIRPQRGGEDVMAQRLQGRQPVLIFVRSDSQTREITPAWRAAELLNNIPIRFYALKTAEDMERKGQWITMLAEAGAADA